LKKIQFTQPNLYLPDQLTIVGPSKIILKKKNGKIIDKSNFVVRFNLAKTSSFKDFTGTKTSLMVINNHVYYSLRKKKKSNQNYKKFLVISPNKLQKIRSTSKFYFITKKMNSYWLALRFYKYSEILINLLKILIKKNFSVGFYFILLCISSGIKLNIYGLDLSENMNYRKHYYKKQKIGGVHNLVLEHKILKQLKKYSLIKFY
jgi:hypothetical protein